jgi:hypothetical protein
MIPQPTRRENDQHDEQPEEHTQTGDERIAPMSHDRCRPRMMYVFGVPAKEKRLGVHSEVADTKRDSDCFHQRG